MSDLERDLRTLLDEKAAGAGAPMPDDRLLRRARRRQLGTVLGGTAVALAIVAGAVVAVSAFGPPDRNMPAEPGDRLVDRIVNGITITHPESWQVVDPAEVGIEQRSDDLPRLVLLLSSAETVSIDSVSCPGLTGGPTDGILMTVQEQPLDLRGQPWPAELETLDTEGLGEAEIGPSGCFPGWTLLQAGWTDSGRTFEGFVGYGPDVTDEDRAALETTFASMRFAPDETGPEAAVIATGTSGGEDWELIASNSGDGLELGIEWDSGGAGIGGMADISDPVQYSSTFLGTGRDRELVLFGATRDPVVRVEFVPLDGGPAVSTEVIDIPETIDDGLDAFVLVVRDPGTSAAGTLRAYDAAGQAVVEIDVPPPMGDEDRSSGEPLPPGSEVASGEGWVLRIDDGSGLCMQLETGTVGEGSCTDTWREEVGTVEVLGFGDRAIVYGFLRPAADRVVVQVEDGTTVETVTIAPPEGFAYEGEAFAIELEGASGAGRVSILDDAGIEIGSADLDWTPARGGSVIVTPAPGTTAG